MRLPSLVFLLLPLVSLGLAAPLHEERPLSLPRETEQIEYPDVQDIMRRVDETDTLSEVEKRQVYDLVLRSPNPTSEVMNIMARAPSCTDMGRKVLSFVGAKKLEYGGIPFSFPPPPFLRSSSFLDEFMWQVLTDIHVSQDCGSNIDGRWLGQCDLQSLRGYRVRVVGSYNRHFYFHHRNRRLAKRRCPGTACKARLARPSLGGLYEHNSPQYRCQLYRVGAR